MLKLNKKTREDRGKGRSVKLVGKKENKVERLQEEVRGKFQGGWRSGSRKSALTTNSSRRCKESAEHRGRARLRN